MVKVKGNISLNPNTKEAEVSLFSDTKNEVTSQMEVSDIPEGYTIAAGSSVLTADGDMAFMKSDGNWNWL